MSKEPEEPRAVFKCKDKDCTKPHYHLDPQVEKLEHPPIETEDSLTDRPIVKVIPDKTTP